MKFSGSLLFLLFFSISFVNKAVLLYGEISGNSFAFPILVSDQHPYFLSTLIGPSRLLRRSEIGPTTEYVKATGFRDRRCARAPYEHM
uniref:PIN1-like auxin transport protein n=1 Tax=Rhizophora mucronata TaxID=61149 RepID=A0A2P2PHU9_RHIMU